MVNRGGGVIGVRVVGKLVHRGHGVIGANW